MKQVSACKRTLACLTSVALSVLSAKTTVATPLEGTEQDGNDQPLAQATCEFGGQSRPFARVTTQQGGPLNVRSAPNGRVIGLIPNGWEVVTLDRDSSGRWVRITSHFGDDTGDYIGDYGFASAPRFRSGWVSTAFVRDLGRFCDKPSSPYSMVQPELFGDRPIRLQEDWIQMADQIAESIDFASHG